MTSIQLVGKFYDNHSLSIINRNIALELKKLSVDIRINSIDEPNIEAKLSPSTISALKELDDPSPTDIEVRHSYPLLWHYPLKSTTRVVYIQPWEFMAIPSEWQYKFDTFADAVITPSRWTADVYRSAGIHPKKIHVIPNGYNPEIFYNTNSRGTTKTFLFVGCSQFRKGLDILLKAWVHATKHSDDVRLIIKDTPQIYGRTNLQQDVLKLQYTSRCGRIEYDDSSRSEAEMAALYNSAHYIVHPYRGEGFGMHIQEAEACGAIPIVTSGGPTDEFVASGIKINTGKRIVNFYDIFALKPGDSASHMGQHKWVLEPDEQHLASILETCKNATHTDTTPSKNTWKKVAEQYASILISIADKNQRE